MGFVCYVHETLVTAVYSVRALHIHYFYLLQ